MSTSQSKGSPTTSGKPQGEKFKREPLTGPQAAAVLRALVEDGWLIGVEVFGAHCCEDVGACEKEGGFGLCDVFGPASVGSDCNRAESWIMRPADILMAEGLKGAIHDEKAYSSARARRGSGFDG